MLSVIVSILVMFQSTAPVQNTSALPDPSLPNRGNPGIDVQHYELNLELQPVRRYVVARAVLDVEVLQPSKELTLDFHHMLEVEGTSVNQQEVSWHQTAHKLTLELPFEAEKRQILEIEVRYRGLLPQTESAGDVVGLLHDGRNLVAYLEPDGAHHFFPCNDHPSDKATYDLLVSVPEGQIVGAIGELIAEKPAAKKGYRLFHWRTKIPTATYLVALGAGKYSLIKREEGRVPVWDYCEPKDREDIEISLSAVPAMIPFFERYFGPYPFEKYGHVLTRNWIGGMEDQTLTVLGREEALSGDPALLSHELGHQWFGDWVSPKQWCDLWLNEGWATFCELLWFEHSDPNQAARTLKSWRKSTIRLAMRSHPHTLANPDPKNLFNPNLVYNKGGMIISLLDGYLGRARLMKATKAYLAEFGGKNAATADFQRVLSQSSGINLDAFFAAWVHQNALPEIKWEVKTEPEGRGWRTTVTVRQVNGHFPMTAALDLLGTETDDRLRLLIRFDKSEVTVAGHTSFKPKRTAFDPLQQVPWVPAEPASK